MTTHPTNLPAVATPPPPNGATAPPPHAPFPVVGLGASAGGLAALQRFFQQMLPTSGMAFVVVVHLAPDYESHLADLLQGATAMPVQQVTDLMPLAPNHVYVIPPNRNLATIDTHLHVSPLETERRARAPIDHFFRTLADAHGALAIGIVLSGTGSDGAMGLGRIKELGGLTIVQEPTDAEYDNMPHSALATGQIDLVLPVAAIPAKLLEYAPHATEGALDALPTDDLNELLPKILTQVRVRTGQDFTHYKPATLLRRITRRMQVLGLDNMGGYLDFLRTHPPEAQLLFRDFLISVTNFFRDPEVFAQLEQRVIPQLFASKGSTEAVRVWVVGCATGEEAYSLAILLLEYARHLDQPPPVQIFATDLNEAALQRARTGVYAETIAEDVSAERLARFFTKVPQGYRVRPEVRDLILFAPHNVLKDPPFSKLDLISCRNVLIYLRRTLLPQILALFHYALHPTKYLLLSPAEGIDGHEHFRVFEKRVSLYQRQPGRSPELHLPLLPLSTVPPVTRTSGVLPPAPPPTGSWHTLYTTLLTEAAPPSVLVNPELNVVYFAPGVNRYLSQPEGAPTQAVLKLVRAELQADLAVALQHARQSGEPTVSAFLPLASEPTALRVRVWPATQPEWAGFALIAFEERPLDQGALAATPSVMSQADPEELTATKQRLQATIEEYETAKEEMKAANEELLSMNEELRSSAEELETSKEELQSINEELLTLNQEHKHKIAEMSQLTNDLQNLLSSTEIATLFLDRMLRIKRFTPRISEIFNILPTDQGRPLTDLTHKLSPTDLVRDVSQVLQTLVPIEREVRTTQGGWYLLRVLPYRTVHDHIEGVVLTFVDISAHKQAAVEREALVATLAAERAQLQALTATLEQRVTERTAALADKNEELTRFAHTAAHDLKAPLRAIEHLAQWLQEEPTSGLPAPTQAHLASLQGRIKRMARLVDDLLAYARVGRVDYRLERVNLTRLIDAIVELLGPPAGFIVTADEALPPLVTARIPLETVLLNLIGNALKHHHQPEQGRVQLTAAMQGDWIEFAVTDNGPGIEAAHVPVIFDLLRTLKPRDEVEGSGMGLTIVKKIVENYGGHIEVESRVGQGTTFRFTWPHPMPRPQNPAAGVSEVTT